MSLREVVAVAPAKVNLFLGVGPVRADGFHPLATVYQALGLYDELAVRPSATDTLTVSGEGVDCSGVPTDPSNLVLRAARLLAGHHGLDAHVSAHLRKRIPVAGGMAGGSADAAAALVACNTLWGLATPRATLLELAARLGSDVPFALVGGTALGTGRGEVVTPVEARRELWWVVVPAEGGLSTPAVYRAHDRLRPDAPVPEVPPRFLEALASGDLGHVARHLRNDLMPPALALRPDLADVLDLGARAGALAGLVSGSGPTTVLLCRSEPHAREVAEVLRAKELPALVTGAPAPGARVTRTSGGAG